MAGWDTNFADTEARGKLPRNVLNQLRAALAERASVVASPPTVPAELSADKRPTAAWFAAFQMAVSNLLPKYANHETSGGDYDGLTAIPVWSEADILTSISAASRIPAPSSGKLVSAWAYQQFLMINNLRWTVNTDFSDTESATRSIYYSARVRNVKFAGQIADKTTAELIAIVNALSYTTMTEYPSRPGLVPRASSYESLFYYISLGDGWNRNGSAQAPIYHRHEYTLARSGTFPFNSSVDVYFYSFRESTNQAFLPSSDYTANNMLKLVRTIDPEDDPAATNLYMPEEGWVDTISTPSLQDDYTAAFRAVTVEKMDVEDGFTFKDW